MSSCTFGPLWAALGLLAAAAPARGAEELRVTGTGTALGAMGRLAPAFARAHPGFALRVLPSLGSTGALKAVADGAIDAALSARPLGARDQDHGLVAMPYARTPFLLAAGPRSGARAISAADAARMYRGELTTWPNGERVRVVLRPRSDVDNEILAGFSAEMAAALEAAQGREGMLVAATNQDCHDTLVHTPGSIGPSSLTQLLTEEAPLTPLTWNGVEPTLANLASGRYPLVKTLYLVVRSPPSAAVRRLIEFLGSPEAARLLEEAGNLPVPLPGAR